MTSNPNHEPSDEELLVAVAKLKILGNTYERASNGLWWYGLLGNKIFGPYTNRDIINLAAACTESRRDK